MLYKEIVESEEAAIERLCTRSKLEPFMLDVAVVPNGAGSVIYANEDLDWLLKKSIDCDASIETLRVKDYNLIKMEIPINAKDALYKLNSGRRK